MVTHDSFLSGSRWRAAAGEETFDVVSPATEEVVGTIPRSTREDMDAAVAAARRAFDSGAWPRMSVRERGEYLLAVVAELEPNLEPLVRVQIDEMGSPYSFIGPGTKGVLGMVSGQIDLIDSIPIGTVRDGLAGKILVSREPIGVVATIIPWNAPVPLIITRMLSGLLTGNTLVIKPPPESPLSAYLVGEAVIAAGLPEGVVSFVPGDGEMGEYLVTHPDVDKVSFTGGTVAGRRVAALCGENLKRSTLELGGKSAAILLEDVDLDQHLDTLIATSMPNTGQVCFATTRILVPRSRSDEVIDRFVTRLSGMKVGDPQDPETRFGPLVSARQRERVEGYIKAGTEEGAKIAIGGGRPADQSAGWYVEPTVFTGVDNGMRIAQEEIFGPVVAMIEYGTEDEAVGIANDSPYGLGGSVFTDDVDHGLEVAGRIKTGTAAVNEGPQGGGGGPFGGVKDSGLGRERGLEGYDSYYEVKSVALPPGSEIGG